MATVFIPNKDAIARPEAPAVETYLKETAALGPRIPLTSEEWAEVSSSMRTLARKIGWLLQHENEPDSKPLKNAAALKSRYARICGILGKLGVPLPEKKDEATA